jgi:hypothetical protein
MKKVVLCIMILACVIMGGAFAQQKPAPAAPAKPAPEEAPRERKNSVALDMFPLFKGFIATNTDDKFIIFIFSTAYERLLVPHFSLGGDLDMYFMNFDGTPGFYFGLASEGRYYPVSDFDKFFVGTALGFNVLSVDGSAKPEEGGFVGITASLKTGYKLIIGKIFYMEPSLSWVLSKISIAGSFIPTPLGWQGGLRVGFVF